MTVLKLTRADFNESAWYWFPVLEMGYAHEVGSDAKQPNARLMVAPGIFREVRETPEEILAMLEAAFDKVVGCLEKIKAELDEPEHDADWYDLSPGGPIDPLPTMRSYGVGTPVSEAPPENFGMPPAPEPSTPRVAEKRKDRLCPICRHKGGDDGSFANGFGCTLGFSTWETIGCMSFSEPEPA